MKAVEVSELQELRALVLEEATFGCCACPDDEDGRTHHKEWCRWQRAKVLVERYGIGGAAGAASGGPEQP